MTGGGQISRILLAKFRAAELKRLPCSSDKARAPPLPRTRAHISAQKVAEELDCSEMASIHGRGVRQIFAKFQYLCLVISCLAFGYFWAAV